MTLFAMNYHKGELVKDEKVRKIEMHVGTWALLIASFIFSLGIQFYFWRVAKKYCDGASDTFESAKGVASNDATIQ